MSIPFGAGVRLPAQLTSLVGREADVQAATAVLRRPAVRLLTFTGPGGVGKTRLALEVAAAAGVTFPDGVYYVGLAPIRDPALVAAAIAETLDVRETSEQSLLVALNDLLRARRLLLLLDNFEQALTAGPLVAALLAGAPQLKLLVTSRAALRVYGEQEVPVAPLALPEAQAAAADLERAPAVQLFCERARAVRPDFALSPENAGAVAAICREVDGLPLALELAAARLKILSPAALLARLERRLVVLTGGGQDRPARQQTLRATLAWSYDLLAPPEQQLFRRLAVFAGGAGLDAAEAVIADVGVGIGDQRSAELSADAPIPDAHPPPPSLSPQYAALSPVLDGLGSLVDNSLVQQREQAEDEPWFRMLETIREYALDRLEASGEAEALRRRHATYFLGLAEAAEPYLMGAARGDWLGRLDQAHDNLRAALAWSRATPEGGPIGLRLAGALVWFWYFRGHLTEGRRWLDGALRHAGADAPPAARAKALSAAGALAFVQSDLAAARDQLEAALALWAAIGSARGRAYALYFLSAVAAQQGDPAADTLGTESLRLFREAGDTWGLAVALDMLGQLAHAAGDEARYIAVHADRSALFRALGDTWGVALELSESGQRAARLGDYAAARLRLEEALRIQRTVGDMRMVAWALGNLGEVARVQGDYDQARALLEEGLRLFREVGEPAGRDHTLYLLGQVAFQQGETARATARFRESLALVGETTNVRIAVRCLVGLAGVALAQGQVERAGELGGAAAALFATVAARVEPPDRATYESGLAALQAQLTDTAFAAGWARGGRLDLAEAIALAAQDPPPPAIRPPRLSAAPPAPPPLTAPVRPHPDDLTRREIEVLSLVATGLTDAEVAARLYLSPRTVQTHLRAIYSKLDITTRSAATRYAITHHLA